MIRVPRPVYPSRRRSMACRLFARAFVDCARTVRSFAWIAIVATFAAAAARAQTVSVDDNCSVESPGAAVNFPWDGSPGPYIVGTDAFATIQGGATAVTAGGTVMVAVGTYNENVTATKAMTLSGPQAG